MYNREDLPSQIDSMPDGSKNRLKRALPIRVFYDHESRDLVGAVVSDPVFQRLTGNAVITGCGPTEDAAIISLARQIDSGVSSMRGRSCREKIRHEETCAWAYAYLCAEYFDKP
jgi:hypothetical protein